jgi:chaperone BCS1
MASSTGFPSPTGLNPQTALLDAFFPGFSLISSALYKYSKIDLNVYFPTILVLGLLVFASQFVSTWAWQFMEQHLMSIADVRIDDEMYNMLMAWIANQQFAKRSRRFVANTNLNSRMWFLWREFNDEEDKEDEVGVSFDEDGNAIATAVKGKKDKKVRFTPSFGTHYFWYKSRLLMFKRTQDTRQTGYGPISEREEISVSCFGRNPTVLKDLLDECRSDFIKNDENRTIIYRGCLKPGTAEPAWTRCVSRVSRPFSTVVLDEDAKQGLVDDMRDYLHPYTARWYSNRGIPYRRGYLFYGIPGTGKTSLSLAIAGYFKLKIYIVSLNSPSMNEENLGTLFGELPKRCVVLLEDIDTAGLTNTRKNSSENTESEPATQLVNTLPGTTVINPNNPPKENSNGKISLSALLNVIDGVASAEGRVLIMTTNHIEKLDAALIRPGRVDKKIKFGLANTQMMFTIFRGIFAHLEGDYPTSAKQISAIPIRTPKGTSAYIPNADASQISDDEKKAEEDFLEQKKKDEEKVEKLASEFAAIIPTMTFSPAEIQGYLLKHKREPEMAVRNATEWVLTTKLEKEKEKEKEKKAREEREKAEREKLEKEKEEKEKLQKEKSEDKKKDEDKEELKVNGIKKGKDDV